MLSSEGMRGVLGLGGLLLLAAGALGCAPSLRMVHQSNTFFERCHSADYDTSVTPDQRHECWTVWLHHYTLGQSPERLAYARARLSGGEVTAMPGIPSAQLGTSYTASYLVMSEDVMDAEGADESTAATPPRDEERLPSPPNPDHQCSGVCDPRWYTCIRRCDEPYGGCREACEIEHRTCLAGCF